MAAPSHSRAAPRPKHFRLISSLIAHAASTPTGASQRRSRLHLDQHHHCPQEDAFTPTTLCPDPARVCACRHQHDLLSEWCDYSAKALARSLERCSSSVHASAMPIDCSCRVLNKPRHRVVFLGHCATQTSFKLIPEDPNLGLHLRHSSFNQDVPRSLAFRRLFLKEGAFSAHLPSLVSTGRQLLAEDFFVYFTDALALKHVRENPPTT